MRRLIQKVSKPEDLDKLEEITSGILGATCWRTSLSYGAELRLHIGARISYSHPALRGKEKGAWMLGTQGSAWRLTSPTVTLASSEDTQERLEQKHHLVEGSTIRAFETSYPDLALTIRFSNGCIFMLFPDTDDNFDLPYWELFTPYRMLLKVGPGSIWSYIPTDLPET